MAPRGPDPALEKGVADEPAGTEAPNDLSKDLEVVMAERDHLKTEHDKLKSERDEYRRLYLDVLAQCRKLELGLLGRGREKDPGVEGQLTMSILEMVGATSSPTPEPDTSSKVREHERAKPTGRKPLPEKLPRVDVTVLPPEVQAAGTDAFEKIGEDTTETVERRPASLVVVVVHKPKFVAKDRTRGEETTVLQAPPPDLPIERGLAGPALLADTIVRRWEDHLPLHRLERIYGREGLELPRSTVCAWHMTLADLVQPVIDAMWLDAFEAPYLCVDATGVLVQDLQKCRHAHFFVVAAPERHVLFGFSPKHDSAAVDALLKGYRGVLVADAHAVYDHLYQDGKVVEAGCWAHLRRYFFKSIATDPTRARHALDLIRKLFQIEREAAKLSPEQRLTARRELSRPIVDAFEAWCDHESARVLDETPIARGIGYARNQRVALRRFLGDGRLPIHNNWSERELRREAIGRKNWLFLGSDEGGRVNANFVSLIASCRLHGLDPSEYLRDLLCLLPAWNSLRVLELAPSNWRETARREDVQRLLAANIYRRASLGHDPP